MSYTRISALASAALIVLLSGCTASGTAGTDQNVSVAIDGDIMPSSAETSSSDGASSVPSSIQAIVPASRKYADGTYSATGNYRSPAGLESIEVTLVLKDDVIIDAVVVPNATHEKSMMMQGKFVAGFKQAVVGKPIDTLTLGVVNGSSLTPVGFMEAVAKIKAQAQA